MTLLLLACSENALVSKTTVGGGETEEGAPDIVVSPTAVDFGELSLGEDASAVISISNEGDAILHLEGLAVDSVDVSWTAISSPIVAAGSAVETVLTWTPTGSALDDALRITSDDPDEPEVSVPLVGTLPEGNIVVDPETWDFGTLEVGASDTVTVTVSNTGDGPLTISDWSYTANDADLQVLDAGDLSSLPAVLDAGASAEVVIQYAPSASGGDEGTLTLDSDDPDTPSTGASQTGNGEEPDPCEGFTQTVDLLLTADDAWQAWIDGTEFTGPNANTWSGFDTFQWELECGDHALAIYATDTAQVISGVIAVVWVEGSVRFVSGPTDWTMIDSAPPSGWTDPAYDDSSWHIPEVCTNFSIWGSTPQTFYDYGAEWIWWSADCTNLGEAWLRLNFTVP